MVEIAPGAFHWPACLPIETQRSVAAQCVALINGSVPAYVPIVRGGGRMHVRMRCLGRHWNGRTYQYESTREDYDGLRVPEVPSAFRSMAAGIAACTGMTLDADLCILNYYDADGRMGLHQ